MLYILEMAVRVIGWVAIVLLQVVPALAEPRWIRIQSEHFEVYSSAGERATRDTAKYFEQVRGFFAAAFGRDAKATQPVRIVIFGSRREYEPYQMNAFATAYYKPGAERDYIVLSEAGLSSYPTATHEYVHLVANHSGMKLPPWLNEGIAELYSTLKPDGSKILVGTLIGGRQQAMMQDQWVPLATICAADRKSPFYNEKDKAGALYNEGWALTHMLALCPEYRPGFPGFVKLIQAGLDTEGAMMKAYSRTMKRMDSEVQAYIRREVFQAVLVPMKLSKVEDELPAEPVARFDVRLTLAELSDHPGKEKEALATLAELSDAFPDRYEVHAALGYQEWRQGRNDQARAQFIQAYDLGSRSPRFLWDYGRLLGGVDAGRAIQAMAALLELEPGRTDVRVELGGLQLASGLKLEARQTLSGVTRITPELAPRFFQILTYVEVANGLPEEAKKAARRWQETADSPTEKLAAGRLADSLSRHEPTAAPMVFTEEERPTLRRTEESAPQPPAAAPQGADGKVEGQFVELLCKEAQAVFVIEVQGVRQSYLIDDPLKITIAGTNGGTMGLTCGKQMPKPVKLEFDKPGAGQTSVLGLLRLIDFGS